MPKHIIDMSGKVVLITGGSRGLGRAMALGFAAAGADIAITSRRIDSCQAAAREIEALGRRALAHACHVGHWDQVNAMIDAVYGHFGKVDVLINNAGMSPLYDRAADIPEALYDKVLEVNLKGPFRLCAEIGQRMAEPDIDFAALARGYGAWAEGPVEDPAALADVFRRAVAEVEAGNVAVVDVRTVL